MSSDWSAPCEKSRTASRIDCCSSSTGTSFLARQASLRRVNFKELVIRDFPLPSLRR